MARRSSPLALACAGLLALIAVGVRIHNAYAYPPDWGFDATGNWRYILRMSEDWALPSPEVGWSTSDPPLFYAFAAALWSVFDRNLVVVPLMNTGLGIVLAGLAWRLVRRQAPDDPNRALLAGLLLLYLPVHVHMSVMVHEEMLAALLASTAVFLLCVPAGGEATRHATERAAGVGLASGLAILSKLSGVLAAATAAAVYALRGWRQGSWRRAAGSIAALLLVAGLVGGWFYARNWVRFGYLQPAMLPVHEVMFDMPPGERSLRDYVYWPWATFTDPQVLNADLLHSVWGSTYTTLWFDGQRFFLPRDDTAVTRWGTTTLLLALLPTAAFGVGLLRGARRALRDPAGADAALVLFSVLTLAGFAYYAWRNPWFVVLKGSSLLALSLPFGVYASEVLMRWARGPRAAAAAVWSTLAALALCVAVTTTFNGIFEKGMDEVSGLPWKPVPGEHTADPVRDPAGRPVSRPPGPAGGPPR